MSAFNTLVLRIPNPDGDFVFRVANVSEQQADQIEHDLSAHAVQPEVLNQFGPPLSLAEVMQDLDNRDFCVLDAR